MALWMLDSLDIIAKDLCRAFGEKSKIEIENCLNKVGSLSLASVCLFPINSSILAECNGFVS